MIKKIDVAQLISFVQEHLMIDVRTPAEFAHGHIPGAQNIPLFSDEERVVIGTAYKQQGKDQAMLIALDSIGPRMRQLLEAVEKHGQSYQSKKVIVHCARGGMRSASFAWLVDFFGYEVLLLEGGYKAFRAYTCAALQQQKQIMVLSGPTGSGKTKVLHALLAQNEQVLDLEALAQHKGSVFGGLDNRIQPSQEQFENDLAWAWLQFDAERFIWIEDESKKIGFVHIPEALWLQMRQAPIVRIHTSDEQRIAHLCAEYGSYSCKELITCVQRLEKHLGGARMQEIIAALSDNDIRQACLLLLQHYDKRYAYGFSKRAITQLRECSATELLEKPCL